MSSGRHENFTKSDRSPKTTGELPKKESIHMANTSIARYVWFPIEWQNGKPMIHWYNEWRIEDFD